MSKLKKVLSLMLAAAMMLGMMLVPTSAAQFKDADQITYAEEVAITAGLGLFAGADGKFMPKDTVTRAQMATIIIKMLHGADANADAFKGVSGGFTDTASFEGGWAEGYINWCASLGIVKGYGDGTFKPGNKVTAAEAVTMILNALKIDAGEGTWPVTVMAKAEEVKFFEDLNTKPSSDKALSREELAVVSLAGLEYSPEGKTGYLYDGKVFDNYFDALLVAGDASKITPAANDTLATKVYELKTAEGFIVANQDTGFEYTELSGGRVFDIETGLDQIGHYVTVYYKEAYESEEKPGVTYAIHDETVTVKVDKAIDTAKEYKAAFGKTYSKNTGITMIDGEYNVSDVTGSIAGYDGGSAAPEGTYIIHKGNIVSYMEPVARYASYITAINTYEGEEGMLINGATEDGSYIPNTEGDDRIVGERGIVEGDLILYTKVQGVYFLQLVAPVEGEVTRVATDEEGNTVITFKDKQYTSFDGDVSGVADKLNTDPKEMAFGQNYKIYITNENEFIGFTSNGSVKLDDIVYVVGSGEVKGKDSYGKQILTTVARCVDMEGQEQRIVLAITKDGETLGNNTLITSGFYSVADSTDKDAKREDVKVLTKVSGTYDGKNVFAVSSSGSDKAFHSSGFTHLKTSDGKQAYGKPGSKYIVVNGDMASLELDIDILETLAGFAGVTEQRFELLVSRSASGVDNLIEVMVISGMTTTEVASGTGAPIYVTEEQIAAVGRTADGYSYDVYNAQDGAVIQIVVDEDSAIRSGETGFYEMSLDDDGLAIITKMAHNAKLTDAFVRQNQGLLDLYSGRDLKSHNTSYTMVYNSSASVKVVDVRSEEQIKLDKAARITTTAQLLELMGSKEGVAIVGDLYVTQASGGDPKVRCIYITSVTHNTPGLQSIVYAFENPGTSGENVKMSLVLNNRGTATGKLIPVTYNSTIDAKTEGFYMYCVDADGEPTLSYVPVGKTANGYPGTMGQHNLVTAVDVAAGTITTEDFHAGCSVACMDQNEAIRGELTVTANTVIYDADGDKITLAELAGLAAGGELIINYYCANSVFAGDTPIDNTPEAIFVVDDVEPGIEIHRHSCDIDHVGTGDWKPLSTALEGFTVTSSNTILPAGRYYLDKDVTLSATQKYLYISGDVALCLNGHTLSAQNGAAYILSFNTEDATLDICDCSDHGNGVIGGEGWKSSTGSTSSAIIVRKSGTVNMYGGNISGITAPQAIYIPAGGTLNMYDGTIAGNTSTMTGKGVVDNLGTFNMYGGEITDNEMAAGVTKTITGSGIFNHVGGTVEDPAPPAPPAPTGPNNHTHDAQWKSLNELIAGKTVSGTYINLYSADSGKYYLTGDLNLGASILQLNSGCDITVCLNGHTISTTGVIGFRYNASSTLNICDCSDGETGKVQLASRASGKQTTTGSVLARSAGTFNLYGGTLVGGVSCVSTNVNIYGGKIQALADGEVLYIHNTAASKINIEGGEFVGYNGAEPKLTHKGTGSVALYGGAANKTSGTYKLIKNGDTYQMQK